MSTDGRERAWVEVDLTALRRNLEAVRRRVGAEVGLLAMVKADGYGLGAERVVRALEPVGPWGYGVAAAEEGAALRRAGVDRPIMLLSPLPPQDTARAAAAGLVVSISNLPGLERWAAAAEAGGRVLEFHVEIDTGMGRAGFDWRDAAAWAPRVLALSRGRVRLRGVFTHFQAADEGDAAPSMAQWARFQEAVEQLPVAEEGLLVHACNSAASVRWPEYACDLVRPGIFLYGARPAPEAADPAIPAPEPVVAVRARVVLLRDVAPGTTVGYGATHAARSFARWATLSIGYGDGLPRALGNRGHALVRGLPAPIVGRVSMDLTVVDVTGIDGVEEGDAATLVGRDGGADLPLEHVAAQSDTIAYEVLTRLSRRLPRVELGGPAS